MNPSEEFERDHGTTDYREEKPLVYDDRLDKAIDLQNSAINVWLVKAPRFLVEKWSSCPSSGLSIGTVRVYEMDDPEQRKISIILKDSDAVDVNGLKIPKEYDLKLNNTKSKNMFIFNEKDDPDSFVSLKREADSDDQMSKKRKITAITGTVNHECVLQPSMNSVEEQQKYQSLIRERTKKAATPARTIKMLDVDDGTASRMASGMGGSFKTKMTTFNTTRSKSTASRTARMPQNELLDLIFEKFTTRDTWHPRDLSALLQQPQVYVKEVLQGIAREILRGPTKGHFKLTQSYADMLADKTKAEPTQPQIKQEEGRVKQEEEEGDEFEQVL